jgi:hypothetical protein
VTPRAREQAPQAKIGMCFATTLSSVSLSGGQPTGRIAFTIDFRIQRSGLREKEDLYLVTRFCEHESVRERKCRPCWVIGTLRAFHHNVE